MDIISLLLHKEMKEKRRTGRDLFLHGSHGWNFRVGGGEQHPGGLCCLIYGTHLTEMRMIGLIEN